MRFNYDSQYTYGIIGDKRREREREKLVPNILVCIALQMTTIVSSDKTLRTKNIFKIDLAWGLILCWWHICTNSCGILWSGLHRRILLCSGKCRVHSCMYELTYTILIDAWRKLRLNIAYNDAWKLDIDKRREEQATAQLWCSRTSTHNQLTWHWDRPSAM